MRHFIIDNYSSLMNAKYNPLRHIPDQNIRHTIMMGLMCMWCIIFAVWTGTLVFLGASIYFHSLLLFGIFVTVGTFEIANKNTRALKPKPLKS